MLPQRLRNLPEGCPDIRLLDDVPCDAHSTGVDPDCKYCRNLANVVAVTAHENKQAWSLSLAIKQVNVTVRVKRTQLPLVVATGSTLHVLQGCTTEPGMIFHFTFPRRLSSDLRWLAVYVALSRVRSLQALKSFGMNATIRAIIEAGPPDTIPAQFQRYFAAAEVATQAAADTAMRDLGWSL